MVRLLTGRRFKAGGSSLRPLEPVYIDNVIRDGPSTFVRPSHYWITTEMATSKKKKKKVREEDSGEKVRTIQGRKSHKPVTGHGKSWWTNHNIVTWWTCKRDRKPDILSHWDNHEQFILNWKYNVTSAIPSHAYSINRLNCVWSETWWGPLDVPSMSLRALASIRPIPRLIPISTVSGADTPWIQYQIAGTVHQTLF